MKIISPRTGRPTNNPKRNQAKIRMTDEELKKLEYCCEETGKSKTEIINTGIEKVYEELQKK